MTFLPIVARELRVASRRGTTFWSRVLAALAAAAMMVWMLGTLGTLVAPDLLGPRIFHSLTALAFLGCLFPGVVLTADCLSREKREGTLGFLFLTDLKGHDVVLGKLVATSLRAVYALLAIFPFLAMPFFIGGLTAGEFWRMVLVLLNTLVLSLAVGMALSALAWRQHVAMMGTIGAVAIASFGLPLLGQMPGLLSPLTSFRLAFDAAYAVEPRRFLVSALLVQAVGWLLLLASGWYLPHSWRGSFVVQRKQGADLASAARTAAGAPARKRLLDERPAEWLATRGNKTGWLWISCGLVVLVWFAGHMTGGGNGISPLGIGIVAIGLHGVMQFWIAWEASGRLNEARRNSFMEQLLTTPLSTPEIVRSQMIALERQFSPPLVVVAACDLILMLVARRFFGWSPAQSFGFSMFLGGVVVVMLLSAYVLARLGLWLGLRFRNPANAALVGLLCILGVPTGLFMVVLYFLVSAVGPAILQLLAGCAVIWVIVTAINAAGFHSYAQRRLRHAFRRQAALVSGKDVPKPKTSRRDWNRDYGLLGESRDSEEARG